MFVVYLVSADITKETCIIIPERNRERFALPVGV